MKPSEREKLRKALLALRAELLRTGPARIEPNRPDATTSGVADEDAQALSEMMQLLASQRNRGQAELLARIDRALAKLASAPEDYGLCEECEEEIAPGRLGAHALRAPLHGLPGAQGARLERAAQAGGKLGTLTAAGNAPAAVTGLPWRGLRPSENRRLPDLEPVDEVDLP